MNINPTEIGRRIARQHHKTRRLPRTRAFTPAFGATLGYYLARLLYILIKASLILAACAAFVWLALPGLAK